MRHETFWHWLALGLNVVLLLVALALVVPKGPVGSIYYVVVSLGLLGLLLYARGTERALVPVVHVGVLLVFLINLVGYVWGAPWYFDIIMHVLGGFFAALYLLAYTYRSFFGRPWQLLVWGFALGVTVGVLWELAEGVGFFFSPTDVGFTLDPVDMLGDLLNDTLGALIASALFVWRHARMRRPWRSAATFL